MRYNQHMVRPKAGSSRGSGPESSPPPAKPTGRHSEFTPETVETICSRLAAGETLRQICKDENLPAASTVVEWCDAHPEFAERYARARSKGLDAIADEIIEIADASSSDYIETENGPRLNAEHVQRSKLRVDSRRWLLSKLRPDKYGDRTAVDVSGSLNFGAAVELVRERRIQRLGRKPE